MKKSLIALALIGTFSGAAVAQSNVTLYGILDVNYMWQELPNVVGTGATARVEQESVDGINAGHQSGSRWGVRGSEALGGGLSAIFTLEGGYDLDRGTLGQGGRIFGRQAWAGLSGGWGSVVAGRLATFSSGTGSFDMIGRVDPFLTGFGLASAGNTFYSMNALRADNTVAYVSPTWGGFKGGVGYSFNVNGTEAVNSDSNNSLIFAGANWTGGPFFAAITYDAVDVAGAGNPDQKHLQIGGTFDLGPVRLHAGWAKQDDVQSVAGATGGSGSFIPIPGTASFDSNSWLLGVTWKIGAMELLGSYQMLDADGQTIAGVNFEPDYNIWSVGATYALSRRTNLYTSYASRDADGSLVGNSFNGKQFAIGVRHLF
ncbi:MAG: porin [Burkholderiaceae bacterium]